MTAVPLLPGGRLPGFRVSQRALPALDPAPAWWNPALPCGGHLHLAPRVLRAPRARPSRPDPPGSSVRPDPRLGPRSPRRSWSPASECGSECGTAAGCACPAGQGLCAGPACPLAREAGTGSGSESLRPTAWARLRGGWSGGKGRCGRPGVGAVGGGKRCTAVVRAWLRPDCVLR